ncbi:MAG: tetratricopeptide repeat protein [Sulfurimonas sp.]
MKHTVLVALIATAVPLILPAAEPSAFGAGNLNNSEPYGLTSNEKVILQNKKRLHKVVVKSNNQANEVDSLRERLDGIQSIIENLSRKSHNNKVSLKRLETQNFENVHNNDEYSKRLSDAVELNSKNLDSTDKVISEVSMLINTIEKNYVSKEEFNLLIKDVNNFKDLVAKELKSRSHATAKKSSNSSADLYDQAKKYYNKKYYTKAISNYEILIKRKYKPAYAHYMIGEMNYKRKNYSNAITYFKKSSSLYAKASYMPNLMLHTAISMDQTGDKEHAQAFYNAVVSKYPGTKEAKEAKKYLDL